MHTQVVLTFIGADRPGLIDNLSGTVSEHQGNWLESRLVQLAGKFAGVALVSIPHAQMDSFQAGISQLESGGLRIVTATAGETADSLGNCMRLTVVGHDRPGIVHEFSHALAKRQINVIEMSSDISSAPMTGGPLFTASASIQTPAHLDLDELADELEVIANELTVEYTLDPED